jgi:glutathione S-transferase
VIEPGSMAKASGWEFKPVAAGWGDHEAMVKTMEHAIAGRDYVLGDTFSIADVIFGGTISFMLRFGMLEPSPAFSAYAARLGARPASQKADARNAAIAKEHGLAT